MDKVRYRFRRFRHKFDIPSCWKPRKDMPKLLYTVLDRDSDSLLLNKHCLSDKRAGLLSVDRRVRVENLVSGFRGNTEAGGEREMYWEVTMDSEGPTVRVATFNVSLFSLAPALPAEYLSYDSCDETPACSSAPYCKSSESSSTFSCVSKSTSCDSNSCLTQLPCSKDSSDSSETCAILSQTAKPTQCFDVRQGWKFSPPKFSFTSPLQKRSGIAFNGPFYKSKLNPVFSFSNRGSSCLVDSLPTLFASIPAPNEFPLAIDTSPFPSRVSDQIGRGNLSWKSTDPFSSTQAERTYSGISQYDPPRLSDVDSYTSGTPSRFSPYNSYLDSSSTLAASEKTCSSSKYVQYQLTASQSDDNSPEVSATPSILDILQEVDADIIALQEVRAEEERGMKPLSEIAEALGMEYAYAESWAPEYGNAVLSRWPIKSASVQQLHDDTDYRNVLKVVVGVPLAGDLHLYCTHLDHLDEDWRLKQVEAFTHMVHPDQPHLLVGNLNSLEESDYSNERWEEISQIRKANRKMPPRGDVMKKLLKDRGYLDSRLAMGEAFSKTGVPLKVPGVQGTCQHGTRVDYILGSPGLPFEYVPGSYTVVPSRGTSNHDLVMVDLQPKVYSA